MVPSRFVPVRALQMFKLLISKNAEKNRFFSAFLEIKSLNICNARTDTNLKVPFGDSIELMSTTKLPSFSHRSHRLHRLPKKIQKFSLHFLSKKEGLKTGFFEISSQLLIRFGSSWCPWKAFIKPDFLIYLVCLKCSSFGKNLKKTIGYDIMTKGVYT